MISLAKGAAHQFRLAGLGAVSIARQFIDVLVEEGKRVEARGPLSLVHAPTTPAGAAPTPKLSLENIEHLEDIFQDRIARSLAKLQVPTQQDLQVLHRQMDALSENIKTLAENPPA